MVLCTVDAVHAVPTNVALKNLHVRQNYNPVIEENMNTRLVGTCLNVECVQHVSAESTKCQTKAQL